MQKEATFRGSSYLIVAWLAVLSAVPLIIAYRHPTSLNDDSFITLTYAKNLAAGNGFVFNHPPAVLGTTTPLLAIILAGLAVLLPSAELPVLAVYFTAFCWLGIMWIFFFFRKQWGLSDWQVGILALVLIGTTRIRFLGMEAYLFALVLIVTVSLFLGRRYWLAGLAAGLLFLTRGEGVLVLAVLLITATVSYWAAERSLDRGLLLQITKLVLGFALPLFFWSIFAQLTFGYVLPNTLAAKQAQAQHGAWNPFFEQLTQHWIPGLGRAFTFEALPFLNFWWLIVLVGFLWALFRKRVWLILLGWLALYVAGYSLLNVSAYWWYQLPIIFILNLFFALGIIAITDLLINRVRRRQLALGLAFLVVATTAAILVQSTYRSFSNYQGDSRADSYTNLGRWFREHTEAADSVAYIEIGYLGFYTDNRIIDLAGLVLPDLTTHIVAGDFAWAFWHYEPDYYVYLPDFDWALGDIRADPRFDQYYHPITTLPGPRQTDFTIFKRTE